MFFVKIRILSFISTFIMTKGLVVYVKSFLEKLEKDLFQHVICRLPAQQNSQCPVDSGWGSRQSDRL